MIEISLDGGAQVNDANIIQADIETSNGIIHVIDMVLSPPMDMDADMDVDVDRCLFC